MNFIAFDLETTGTVPGVDQIVEIGAVKFENYQPTGVYSTLINPGRSMPAEASKVNGITDDMLVGKPKIEDLLDSFAEFCGDNSVVAHNAPFDAQFLAHDIKRYESDAPSGVLLDTLPMARKVLAGLPNYRLGTLVQHFGIPAGQFHRAEEDANYCGQVFIELVRMMSAGGTVPEVSNLVAMTGKPEYRFPKVKKDFRQLSLL